MRIANIIIPDVTKADINEKYEGYLQERDYDPDISNEDNELDFLYKYSRQPIFAGAW